MACRKRRTPLDSSGAKLHQVAHAENGPMSLCGNVEKRSPLECRQLEEKRTHYPHSEVFAHDPSAASACRIPISMDVGWLYGLDSSEFDHFGPLFCFGGDQLSEISR